MTERAIEFYKDGIEKAAGQGDLHSQAIALDNMGVSLSGLKRYAESGTAHERSLAIFRELGASSSTSASLNHLGLVCTKTGDYARAGNYFSESLAVKRDLGDQRGQVSVLINFAEMHLVQEHWDDMLRLCNEAIEVIGDQPFHEPLAIATFLIGIWYFEAGNTGATVKHFASAIAMGWNFNPVLGQRINRSVIRHFKTMNQLGKTQDLSGLKESILDSVRGMVKDEKSAAINHLRSLLMDEQNEVS